MRSYGLPKDSTVVTERTLGTGPIHPTKWRTSIHLTENGRTYVGYGFTAGSSARDAGRQALDDTRRKPLSANERATARSREMLMGDQPVPPPAPVKVRRQGR